MCNFTPQNGKKLFKIHFKMSQTLSKAIMSLLQNNFV